MDYKVLIAESAINDLGEIVTFVAQGDSAAAARLGNKLIDLAVSLGKMPHRFPMHDQRRAIRKVVLRPYLIFYQCDDAASHVYVLHFWHGARVEPDFSE